MLSENIRRLRLAKGINQVELAVNLGVTKQTVSNWENNNIQPSIEMLVAIAKYFSVSCDSLLGLDNRKYIEITGLTDKQISNIQALIDDLN